MTIKNHVLYDARWHAKQYVFTKPNYSSITYGTLCSDIKNYIDHPGPTVHTAPTEEEMKISIELLRELCRRQGRWQNKLSVVVWDSRLALQAM